MKFPSKKELDETKQEFPLLPAEDYRLEVVKLEMKTQEKYQSKEEEEVINVTLEVVSYKDGEVAHDVDGKEAKGRRVFFTARPDSIGFQNDGTPSKTRALVAFATGQDVYGEIDLESWEFLLGKRVDAEIIQKENTKGVVQNRISRFIAPKGQRPKPVPEEVSVDDEVPIPEE